MLGSVAASVVAAVDAMQSGSQSDIVVEPVEVEPCSPQGSALTSAFTLLRQVRPRRAHAATPASLPPASKPLLPAAPALGTGDISL